MDFILSEVGEALESLSRVNELTSVLKGFVWLLWENRLERGKGEGKADSVK